MGYTNTTPQFGLPQYAPADMPQREDFNKAFKTISENMGKGGNDNLLDNWYFADPIDQRGGYVVPPGTAYAEPNGSTIGTLTQYLPVTYISSSGYPHFIMDGTEYVGTVGSAVRGYVGNGYTIDRWKKDTLGTIIVLDDCIEHHGTSHGFYEVLEPDVLKAISGKVCTMSALVRSPNGSKVQLGVGSGDGYVAFTLSEEWTVITRQFVYDYENYPNRSSFVLRAGINDGNEHVVQYKAAKLELGDKQTLAHQDENGNWVLNDPPPNKALELAKCQRYFKRIKPSSRPNANIALGYAYATSATTAWLTIPVADLRIAPAIKVSDITKIGLTKSSIGNIVSYAGSVVSGYMNYNGETLQFLLGGLSGLTTGDVYLAWLVESSKLSYIDLDANL